MTQEDAIVVLDEAVRTAIESGMDTQEIRDIVEDALKEAT